MNYLRNNKGQGLVEFAVVLLFAVFLGVVSKDEIMPAAGALFTPTKVVLAEIDHRRTYDVAKAIEDMQTVLTHYKQGNSSNKADYRRGMLRSGWIDNNAVDSYITELKNLYDEVGARQWSYLTGEGYEIKVKKKDENGNVVKDENGNDVMVVLKHTDAEGNDIHYGNYLKLSYQQDYFQANGDFNYQYAVNDPNTDAQMYIGDKGLYWTVQDLSMGQLDRMSLSERHNFSKQLVLQYFYSTWTRKYYVIKSHVWLNQGDVDNRVALAGLRQQYYKPAGYFVEGCTEGFSTLAEAKEVFEKVRAANGYSVIFQNTDVNGNEEAGIKPDINAGNYVLNTSKTEFVDENQWP